MEGRDARVTVTCLLKCCSKKQMKVLFGICLSVNCVYFVCVCVCALSCARTDCRCRCLALKRWLAIRNRKFERGKRMEFFLYFFRLQSFQRQRKGNEKKKIGRTRRKKQ